MKTKLMAVVRLIGLGALGVTALTQSAHACEPPLTDLLDGVLAAIRRDLQPIPRNAAFVWSRSDTNGVAPTEPVAVAVDSTSQAIMARVLKAIKNRPGVFIAKPDEPLPPNFQIQSGGDSLTTGDYLDEVPPDTPSVTESIVRYEDRRASSCFGLTSLGVTLAEPAKDDHAPAGRVAYAVYLEKSADAARTTPTPFAVVSESYTINATTLVVTLDASWADSDAFVSVSAIDWAANESPRTEPRQANSSGSGCAVSLPCKRRPTVAIALAMLTGLALARRTKRRRQY